MIGNLIINYLSWCKKGLTQRGVDVWESALFLAFFWIKLLTFKEMQTYPPGRRFDLPAGRAGPMINGGNK